MKPRNMRRNPYSTDEARVAAYFFERGTGGGDDPIGSILAAHSFAIEQRNLYRKALERLRDDLTSILPADVVTDIAKQIVAAQSGCVSDEDIAATRQ